MNDRNRRLLILALSALAYFVAYPDDAQAVTQPLNSFLNLTMSVSSSLYSVATAAIIAYAIMKTWGTAAQGVKESRMP